MPSRTRQPDRFRDRTGLIFATHTRMPGLQQRLAAGDMHKALDLLERTFGGAVAEVEAEPARQATGTDGADVLPFRARSGLGAVAQRIVAAAKARPLTKAQLRTRVRGGQGEFLRGLREAIDAGALRRDGSGTKARPYLYRSEGA